MRSTIPFVLLLIASPCLAADDKPSVKPPRPIEFEARMSDGSIVKFTPLDSSIILVTRYGKLTIPLADVHRVDVGFRYPDGVEARIKQAIEGLASESYRDREDAQKVLLDYGELSFPALNRATKGTDPEAVRRAEAALKLLTEKVPEDRRNVTDQDVIETAEFTVRGRIEAAGLKVRTRYFAEPTLSLADLRAIRATSSALANDTLTLDAAQYARVNDIRWLDTGVTVASEKSLEISVSGQIDMWPQGPGQYMATPLGLSGYARPGMIAPGGIVQIAPGMVVGRIGETGTPFGIGEKYRGKPPASGKLYIRIQQSPWGNDSSGSYKVKIGTGE